MIQGYMPEEVGLKIKYFALGLLWMMLAGCASIDSAALTPAPVTQPPVASLPVTQPPAAQPAATLPAFTALPLPPATAQPVVAPSPTTPPNAVTLAAPLDAFTQARVDQARQDLATRLGLPLDQVTLGSVQQVTWPDGGLGCPQPGMSYIQVPVDGLLIRLQAGGQVYAYHSGGERGPFLCKGS